MSIFSFGEKKNKIERFCREITTKWECLFDNLDCQDKLFKGDFDIDLFSINFTYSGLPIPHFLINAQMIMIYTMWRWSIFH